jgi:hypothetical protein
MAPQANRTGRVDRRWWWLAGFLTVAGLGLGCSPASFYFLLAPWVDDKMPPKCKLAKKGEEAAVVVYAQFVKGEVPLELEPAAGEMMDVLASQLRQRFAANKEKVTVIPPSKVRSFMNNRLGRDFTDQELADHFKANYVVRLNIHSLSLYERGGRMLFRGNTEIEVVATEHKANEDENRLLKDVYRLQYPGSGPIEAGSSSPLQFRTMFLNRIGRDLSRWFAAFPKEERLDMD